MLTTQIVPQAERVALKCFSLEMVNFSLVMVMVWEGLWIKLYYELLNLCMDFSQPSNVDGCL